jgi:signal transduction histidine kinase
MRRRGLVTQVAFASAVLGAALVAVFTLLVLAIHDLRDSSLKARHSQEAIAAANNAETLVIDLETGLRGYFLTRNRKLLRPFKTAREELPEQLQRLMTLVADEPDQVQRVERIREGERAYTHDYGEFLIGFIRRNRQVNPADVIQTRVGFNRIAEIRKLFTELIRTENRLAASRDASASTYAARATILGSTGAALALLLVLLFGMYIARRMVHPIRQTAEAAEGLAGGDLSSRVVVAGQGEVRALGESFNQMAASLERTQGDLAEQNRRLRESEQAKTELINTVSHELRTPLASILGFADVLLRRSELQDDERRYLELIRGESTRLATLLNDLLDVQRIEQGQIDLVRERLDLNGLVETQVALYSAQSERHVVSAVVPDEATLVFADPGRLAQVIGNLLSNAIKYSPDGGAVAVEVESRDGFGRVAVTDCGLGIGREFQSRIFTKFFRADVARLGIGGTGLGLALARQIVGAHGGRIGFTSEEGTGSTFWIEIPSAAATAAGGSGEAGAAAGDQLEGGNGGERRPVGRDAAAAGRTPEADAGDVRDRA